MAVRRVATGRWIGGKFFHEEWTVTDTVADPNGVPLSGGGSSSFIGLTDTPVAYGSPGEFVVINGTGDGLVFQAGGGSGSLQAAYDGGAGIQVTDPTTPIHLVASGTGPPDQGILLDDLVYAQFGTVDVERISLYHDAGAIFHLVSANTTATGSHALRLRTGDTGNTNYSGSIDLWTGAVGAGIGPSGSSGGISIATGANSGPAASGTITLSTGTPVDLANKGVVNVYLTRMHLGPHGPAVGLRLPTTTSAIGDVTGSQLGDVVVRTDTDTLYFKSTSGWTAAGGGGSSLWTDAGAFTYLTATTDNVILGASTQTGGERLQVNGAVTIGASVGSTLGSIRWTGADFEGYNGAWVSLTSGGGGGEANIGANVGAGTGQLYRDKTGITLNFKSLVAGSGVGITNGADTVTLTAPGAQTMDSTYNLGHTITVDAGPLVLNATSGNGGIDLNGLGVNAVGVDIDSGWLYGIYGQSNCRLLDNVRWYFGSSGSPGSLYYNTAVAMTEIESTNGIYLYSNNYPIYLDGGAGPFNNRGTVILGHTTENLTLGWHNSTTPASGTDKGSLHIRSDQGYLYINEGTSGTSNYQTALTHVQSPAGAHPTYLSKSGSTVTLAGLTAGSGISLASGAGAITITNTNPTPYSPPASVYAELYKSTATGLISLSGSATGIVASGTDPRINTSTTSGFTFPEPGVITVESSGIYDVDWSVTVQHADEASEWYEFMLYRYAGSWAEVVDPVGSSPTSRQRQSVGTGTTYLNISSNCHVALDAGMSVALWYSRSGAATGGVLYLNMSIHRINP